MCKMEGYSSRLIGPLGQALSQVTSIKHSSWGLALIVSTFQPLGETSSLPSFHPELKVVP